MDIIDYIKPAACNSTQFRAMWAEFECENKVAVNTDIVYDILFVFRFMVNRFLLGIEQFHKQTQTSSLSAT